MGDDTVFSLVLPCSGRESFADTRINRDNRFAIAFRLIAIKVSRLEIRADYGKQRLTR